MVIGLDLIPHYYPVLPNTELLSISTQPHVA
jgi:hypothetical protein